MSGTFNTDGQRTLNKELFNDMYDGSAYGGYDPLQPMIDDLTTPQNLEGFNDYMRMQMNPRFRKAHQRIATLEKSMVELGRNKPGFARSYLRRFTSTLFRKEYMYSFKDNYIYTAEYDSSGSPYDWESRFGERVVILPCSISIPLSDDEIAVMVYRDGRPLSPDYYDFHRQQSSFSVFIPYSHFDEGCIYTVEIRRYWNQPTYMEVRATENNVKNGVLNFVVDETAVGINYSADLNMQNDYKVFLIANDAAKAQILPESEYSIRRADSENISKLIISVRAAVLGMTYVLVNNSAGWCKTYQVADETNSVALDYVDKHFPIFASASELIVDVFEPEDKTGMSFRLVPNVDYTLEENVSNVSLNRVLSLARKVPAGTKVRVTKSEPSSWLVIEGYLALMDTNGIVEVPVTDLPLDVIYMDVYINNKVVEKSRMVNILDTCFRIKEYDSSHYLYYRAAFPRTAAICKLISEYQLFKPDLERFIEHVGFNSNITIVAGGGGSSGGGTGENSDEFAFIHTHSFPEKVWVVQHNLGYQPALAITSALTGAEIDADKVEHIDNNTVKITFSEPTAGRVKLI